MKVQVGQILDGYRYEGGPVNDPSSWTAVEDEMRRTGTGRDLARSYAAGGTFNFADEMQGLLTTGLEFGRDLLTGQVPEDMGQYRDIYESTRDYEREQAQAFAEESPYLDLGAKLAGGVALGGGAALPVRGAGVVSQLPVIPRYGAYTGIGAGAGAAGGALEGAGQAKTMADVPGAAAQGAATGAMVGAVTGPVAGAIGDVVGGVRRLNDPAEAARLKIQQEIARAGADPADVAIQQRIYGTLADTDVLGDTFEGAITRPGPVRAQTERALNRRSAQQLQRFAAEGKVNETVDALDAMYERTASPMYERAFERGVQHNDVLEEIFEDVNNYDAGLWGRAKKEGRLALANKGIRLSDEAIGESVPTLRGWQFIKERLDDDIEGLLASTRTGTSKSANTLIGLRRRLLNELDAQNPEFMQARAIWAGGKSAESALSNARKFFSKSSADFERELRGMSQVEKEATQIGVLQAIQDRLEKMGYTHDITRVLNNPAFDRKMQLLFSDQRGFYADLKNQLQVFRRQQQTLDRLRGNSRTALRQQQQADVEDFISDQLVELTTDVATNNPINLLRRFAEWGARRADTVPYIGSRREAYLDELSRVLADPNVDMGAVMAPPRLPPRSPLSVLPPALVGGSLAAE